MTQAGDVFNVPYPFVRDTYDMSEFDEDGCWVVKVPTWRPGVRIESGRSQYGEEFYDSHADAMGTQVLTVLSVHKPSPRHAPRVFYTRKWIDPDGREFGKNTLMIRSLSSFTALTHGYRHRFALVTATQVVTA